MYYWFKQSVKLFFTAEKKELFSLFVGLIILFVGVRLKAPQLENLYAIAILILLTMACRYNFVADYIISSDMKDLSINKKVLAYVISKNLVSFLITFFTILIATIIQLFITNTVLSIDYYINLIVLGLYIISLNNIIFIFHNTPSELRSNDYSAIRNIELGFKDLIESLPSLIIVFAIYYFDIYLYNINIYQSMITWIFSVLFLKLKVDSLIKNTI